jgi:hypothetical protein
MTEHQCEHLETITEIKNDVKWLVQDIKRRNGIVDDHIISSEKFRLAVERNTVWRHFFKLFCVVATGVTGGLLWAWFYHLSKGV